MSLLLGTELYLLTLCDVLELLIHIALKRIQIILGIRLEPYGAILLLRNMPLDVKYCTSFLQIQTIDARLRHLSRHLTVECAVLGLDVGLGELQMAFVEVLIYRR